MPDPKSNTTKRVHALKSSTTKRVAKPVQRNVQKKRAKTNGVLADYPRHALRRALRIPQAILEQHAGRACTDRESAGFCKIGFHGPYKSELSSAIKYGFLSRPTPGQVEVTPLARRVLRPTSPSDELSGLRTALLNSPQFGEVYQHYRGENIPDEPFLSNTLIDTFKIPAEKVPEFKPLFFESLEEANLVEKRGDKLRVLDVSEGEGVTVATTKSHKELENGVRVTEGESCFVMMPFDEPIGGYYKKLYEPAIEKTGLRPIRADDDIFAVGKIIDQVWTGISAARVLVAELTGRNPNVFYELGIAHALRKPVVLIASNEIDVPFDVRHIRVIYYDKDDPFWGDKLMKKIAENILSAINNPEEAIFRAAST